MTHFESDCVFCNIVQGVLPADKLMETDSYVVIADLMPKAPIHWLIIPKDHITGLAVTGPEQQPLLGELLFAAKLAAETAGISETGYKVAINSGVDGGQVIPHLHLHLLGGKKLAE